MKPVIILGAIVFTVMILGIITIPSVDAASNGRLTINFSQKSVTVGEPITFSGKLTDRNGYAMSNAQIIIWENDGGKNSHVAYAQTDARGEYRVTVTAEYWDGIGNAVEIFAYSGRGSLKSTTVTINIDKPNPYTTKPEVKNYVQPTPSNYNISTNLVLKLREGVTDNSIQLKPVLSTSGGAVFTSDFINIYVNNKVIRTISTYEWSKDIKLGEGFFTFVAKFDGLTSGTTTYQSSSGQVNYDHTKITSSSTQTSSNTKSNTDEIYKDPSYKIKSKYYAALQELETGVKLSESSLSGIVFENSDAKKKLKRNWISLGSLDMMHGVT